MWFKVDDTLAFHDKVVAAGNPAMGLWVRAGAWSSQMLTDGHVPTHMVAAFAGATDAARLVEVGLWDEADDGYQFHGWEDFQFTREEVEAKRAVEREKKRKQRAAGTAAASESRGEDGRFTKASPVESLGDTDGDSLGVSSATRPVPTKTPTESPSGVAAAFDTFWDLYPKKVGRGAALRSWKTAAKRASTETILAGLNAQLPSWRNSDRQFIPNPTTWLNQERWTDEIQQPQSSNMPEGWGRIPQRASNMPEGW